MPPSDYVEPDQVRGEMRSRPRIQVGILGVGARWSEAKSQRSPLPTLLKFASSYCTSMEKYDAVL